MASWASLLTHLPQPRPLTPDGAHSVPNLSPSSASSQEGPAQTDLSLPTSPAQARGGPILQAAPHPQRPDCPELPPVPSACGRCLPTQQGPCFLPKGTPCRGSVTGTPAGARLWGCPAQLNFDFGYTGDFNFKRVPSIAWDMRSLSAHTSSACLLPPRRAQRASCLGIWAPWQPGMST